jgi:hypothetical protein
VCYSERARTNMIRLERVQYRGIRITLEPMYSTSKNRLEILSGIAPLTERFVYPNYTFFVAGFFPTKRRLDTLRKLNMGRCITSYSDVLPSYIVSSEFNGKNTVQGSSIYIHGGAF